MQLNEFLKEVPQYQTILDNLEVDIKQLVTGTS